MPPGHVQEVDPAREVEFAGHSRHKLPSAFMYVPSAQEQEVDPADAVELLGQGRQEELPFGSGE